MMNSKRSIQRYIIIKIPKVKKLPPKILYSLMAKLSLRIEREFFRPAKVNGGHHHQTSLTRNVKGFCLS